MIKIELLTKYKMVSLEEYKKVFGDSLKTEKTFYETFLQQTDHIPSEIFESFIETMTNDKINVGNMIKFFKEVKTEYAEVLEARKNARKKLAELEAQSTTP